MKGGKTGSPAGNRSLKAAAMAAPAFLVFLAFPRAEAACPSGVATATIYHPSPGSLSLRGMALDGSDNVVLAGWDDASGTRVWHVAVLDPSFSAVLGSTTYSGAVPASQAADAVEVAGNGDIIVGGKLYSSATTMYWSVRRYDSALNVLVSSTTYNLGANATELRDVELDPSGNVIVVGSHSQATGGNNWFVRKYDAALSVLLAATTFDGPDGGEDVASSVAVDGAGNVTVAGLAEAAGKPVWMVRKYDPSLGALLESLTYNDPGWPDQGAPGIARDPAGDFLLSGFVGAAAADHHWRLLRYDAGLGFLSTTTYDPPGAGTGSAPSDVVVAADGSVIVAGSADDPMSGTWCVRKYASDFSSLLGSTKYADAGTSQVGIMLAAGGDLVAAGSYGFTNGIRVVRYPESQACLQAGVTVDPAKAAAGASFAVHVTVTNTGIADVRLALPAFGFFAGTSYVSAVSGPDPTGPVVIPAGMSQGFTWLFAGKAPGVAEFSVTISGTDDWMSVPAAASATGFVTIYSAAVLSSTVAVTPPAPVVGDWLAIALTVTNEGGVNATGVRPDWAFTLGGALLAYRSGPLPPGPAVLSPGSGTTFVWTYSVSGAGAVRLSVTGLGADSVSGTPLVTGSHAGWSLAGGEGSGTVLVAPVAILSATVSVTPNPATAGDPVTIVLRIGNTGGVAADGVTPALESGGDATALVGLGPAGSLAPVSLDPGGSRSFTWTARAKGIGAVALTGLGSGTDRGSGGRLAAAATVRLVLGAVPAPPGGIWMGSTTGRMPVVPGDGEAMLLRLNPREEGKLRVHVYSLLWEEVAELADGNAVPGAMEVRWDGRNRKGEEVAAGVYLVRVEMPGEKAVTKRVLIGKRHR